MDAADLQRRTRGDQKDQRLSIAQLTTKVQTKCIFYKTKVPILRLSHKSKKQFTGFQVRFQQKKVQGTNYRQIRLSLC